MSIFKATFPAGVKEQITARQDAMVKRDATTITYLNSRTAWIRMTSAVDVNEKDNYAKNNVLLGGALYNKSPRTGVGTTGENAYSTNTANNNSHRLGMRPMPGITSINVKNKGAYGSLREITIDFQCWDIAQLEELELLYMRPGYTVLVEWGWMPYLTNDGKLGNDIDLTDDVLNGKTTKEEIWKSLHSKASKDGNYDAIYGRIQNYSWKARPDGGYDCTTSLITMGEILESLKVNYIANINILKSGGTGLFGLLDASNFLKETPINKSYSQNVLAGMLNEIWEIAVTNKQIPDLNSTSFDLKGTSYDFFRYDLSIEGRTNKAIEDSFVEKQAQIYITLEGFVDLMNKYILIEDTEAKKPLAALSVKEGAHNGGKEGDLLLCLGHRFQLSTDPTICLIKNPNWATPEKSLGITTVGTDTQTIVKIMTNLGKDFFTKSSGGGLFGTIGNIYVNIGYLYGLIVSDDLASQDPKEKRDINLYDYIKNVLGGINTSIGNVATLELFIDPVDSVGRIIDLNYVDIKEKSEVYKNAFSIEVHNLKSIVRSYSLESQFFPDQSTTVAIGAQVDEGGALGVDSNIMLEFNKGLRDRIIPVKKAPDDDKEDDLKSKIESLKNSLEVILSYINKTDPSWYEHAGDFDVDDSSKYANALKDIIQFDRSLFKDDNKNRSIMPTKLSLEMDGIGGIVVGNIFKISEDVLPQGYKGEGTGAQIAYVVNEIETSISNNNDWITKIGAQLIILDEPGGNDSGEWNTVKNKIISTAVIVKTVPQAEKEIVSIIDVAKDIIEGAKQTTKPVNSVAKRSSNTNCRESYQILTSTNAPGVTVPDGYSWDSIKKTFPIIQGGVPVTAIGTPLDAGNDFYFKMTQTRVSKRTKPVNYIVLHYTVSEENDPTYHYQITWNRVTDKPSSADFAISRTGKIAGFKSFKTYKSWHYGEATWPGGVGFNNESIGLELESIGWAYYCKTNNKFYTNNNKELNTNEVALTRTYRGHNLWHYHTNVQISATANLIIALYNSGIISDKTKFLLGCTGNNRYDTLFPDDGLTTKPAPGIITHGTGRKPSGKVDTFPQKNLLAMLDDLPNLIKSTPNSFINWKTTL